MPVIPVAQTDSYPLRVDDYELVEVVGNGVTAPVSVFPTLAVMGPVLVCTTCSCLHSLFLSAQPIAFVPCNLECIVMLQCLTRSLSQISNPWP